VFVDVTADWCITCLANEQAVLFTDDMTRAFEDAGVTYMVADWTNYDPAIGTFVREHGRNGIPLYVLYSRNRSTAPVILPQLLTRNIMMEALAGASE
jgi:thiol:disulfide interchange protein DsbD